MTASGFGLYVHIPFCLHRCAYCDFNTYAVPVIPEREYVSSLLAELDFRANHDAWRGRELRTIYFGGGTPSLFSAESIRRILSAGRNHFKVLEGAEVTLEANPGTVDGDKLLAYAQAGVNRISLGVQSFQTKLLKTLGRIHGSAEVESAVSMARAAGIGNISLDLMYGVPGQDRDVWALDLHEALKLRPEHISIYSLTIEKGTPFYLRRKKGELTLPSEDETLLMMDTLEQALAAGGFGRYEISNYARPAREALHNLNYWDGGDYLGLGAGAHSFFATEIEGLRSAGTRWANVALPEKFIDGASSTGKAEAWGEMLAAPDLVFEFFFLGLRKLCGVDLSKFERWFGVPAQAYYGSLIETLVGEGLLVNEGTMLRLSDRGLMVADSVIEHLASPKKKPRSVREPRGRLARVD